MFQRYFFIVALVSALVGLVGWANRAEIAFAPGVSPETVLLRQDLLETLDQLVAAEKEYFKANGYYTRVLGRLNVGVPLSVGGAFAIHVDEAGARRLQISAASENRGQVADAVSIDQDFRLRANFVLPAPRLEYLKARALDHMQNMRKAGVAPTGDEGGIYSGYFRFETNEAAKVVVASGIQAPVSGLVLEYPFLQAGSSEEDPGKMLTGLLHRLPSGPTVVSNVRTGQQEQRRNRFLAGGLEIEAVDPVVMETVTEERATR